MFLVASCSSRKIQGGTEILVTLSNSVLRVELVTILTRVLHVMSRSCKTEIEMSCKSYQTQFDGFIC